MTTTTPAAWLFGSAPLTRRHVDSPEWVAAQLMQGRGPEQHEIVAAYIRHIHHIDSAARARWDALAARSQTPPRPAQVARPTILADFRPRRYEHEAAA